MKQPDLAKLSSRQTGRQRPPAEPLLQLWRNEKRQSPRERTLAALQIG